MLCNPITISTPRHQLCTSISACTPFRPEPPAAFTGSQAEKLCNCTEHTLTHKWKHAYTTRVVSTSVNSAACKALCLQQSSAADWCRGSCPKLKCAAGISREQPAELAWRLRRSAGCALQLAAAHFSPAPGSSTPPALVRCGRSAPSERSSSVRREMTSKEITRCYG